MVNGMIIIMVNDRWIAQSKKFRVRKIHCVKNLYLLLCYPSTLTTTVLYTSTTCGKERDWLKDFSRKQKDKMGRITLVDPRGA